MSTLSNVSLKEGSTSPPCNGVKSITPPEVNTNDGVSVDSVIKKQQSWYVLRVSYGRVKIVEERLKSDSFEYYIPLRYKKISIKGKKKLVKEPLLPNFVFVYSTIDAIENLMRSFIAKGNNLQHFLTYYYDHFHELSSGKNPPLTIRKDDMENFIRLTSCNNEHIVSVSQDRCHYQNGDTVIITQGDFKGVIGKVARILGQQRVVVNLNGLCIVATAYIPSDFIKPYNIPAST